MSVFGELASGDFIGAILLIFTDVMGPIFGVLVSLIVFIPLTNRLGWATPILAGLMFWVVFAQTLPAEGLNVGSAIMTLGVAAIILLVFVARRRQSG